jgi:DivIVA domain-containing protein
MEWFLWTVAVAVLGLAAVAGTGRFGGMPDAGSDVPGPSFPDGTLTGDDLRGARFGITLRGYSVDQVDSLLARLASQLDATAHQNDGETSTSEGPTTDVVDTAVGGICDNGGERSEQE